VLTALSNDTIVVLENCCLCCTVFGDLVTMLNNLYHVREAGEISRFDHVVIETSGLADPSPLNQVFLSNPTLAGLYRIGTIVATVDAVNGPDTFDKHVESLHQVALADHILITKLDLIDATKVEQAEAALTARRNVGGSHAPGNRSAEIELAGWSGRSLQTPRNRWSWSLSSSRSRERPL
jgi:G3E family GTPase